MHNGQLVSLKAEDHIQRTLLWYGFYEKESILTWENFVKADSVVIDVGANIGYYTLVAANKATNGTVHSFEPVSKNYKILGQNIQLNHLSNVVANNEGISNVETLKTYYVSSDANTGMSGMTAAENFSGTLEEKQTVTLDGYAIKNNLSKIDLVKIDIEGNEFNALKGMTSILERYKPVIFIELIDKHLIKFGTCGNEVYAFLKSYGYIPYEIVSANNLKVITDTREGEVIIFK